MLSTVDNAPWRHPYLAGDGIAQFRSYSEQVWEFALCNLKKSDASIDVGFSNNMAQNMYKWARMSQDFGAKATLYLHPQDTSAISRPEWEEFDGEYSNLFDASGFLDSCVYSEPEVPCFIAPNEGSALWSAYYQPAAISERDIRRREVLAKFSKKLSLKCYPLEEPQIKAKAVDQLRHEAPSVDHAILLKYAGHYPYYSWAKALARHDVTYIASTPFPALAGGKPYCACPVGGDFQMDCGRDTDGGRAMLSAYRGANFVFISNPHMLGHCRRLGINRAVYLPYPMDTDRYKPGEGLARKNWEGEYGGDCYILVTSRIDADVKGFGQSFLEEIQAVALARPGVRFVMMGWGENVESFKTNVAKAGLGASVIVISPVGKRRLIDYYRSCDIVLDQLVYGYYGATALEAASCGKPVVMKIRSEHYSPLYAGDVAPVYNVDGVSGLGEALIDLADNPEKRSRQGQAMREWLLRNHGQEKTTKLMLALLRLAAEKVRLPGGIETPLASPLSLHERAYHAGCKIDGTFGHWL